MAFIRKLSTASGVRYELRWRPASSQADRSQRFESHDQAKAFKAQTEAAQSRGIAYDPARGRIRFQTYAEQWMEGRPLASTTLDNYAETLERHVYPTFGATPIGRLTPDEARRWFRQQPRQRCSPDSTCSLADTVTSPTNSSSTPTTPPANRAHRPVVALRTCPDSWTQ